MFDKHAIITCLHTETIAVIPDNHKDPKSRLLVKELLEDVGRPVKAFFFEWQQNNNLNAALSKIPFSRSKKNFVGIHADLSQYFAGAAKDAEPGILELVGTAVSNDIIAIASDADYAKVTEELGGSSQFLFQPTGLAARDKAAATFIKENIIASKIGVGRLLLWGAGHFTENLSYGDCLHQCLINLGLSVRLFGNE